MSVNHTCEHRRLKRTLNISVVRRSGSDDCVRTCAARQTLIATMLLLEDDSARTHAAAAAAAAPLTYHSITYCSIDISSSIVRILLRLFDRISNEIVFYTAIGCNVQNTYKIRT